MCSKVDAKSEDCEIEELFFEKWDLRILITCSVIRIWMRKWDDFLKCSINKKTLFIEIIPGTLEQYDFEFEYSIRQLITEF